MRVLVSLPAWTALDILCHADVFIVFPWFFLYSVPVSGASPAIIVCISWPSLGLLSRRLPGRIAEWFSPRQEQRQTLPWASQHRRLHFPSITMPWIPSCFVPPALASTSEAGVISVIPWDWSLELVRRLRSPLSRPQPASCRRAGSGFSSVFLMFCLSMRGISCPELLLIGYCLPNLLLTFIHIRGLFGPIACFFAPETFFVICVVSVWCVVISEPGEFRVVHAPHDYVLGHRLGVLAGGPIAAAQELRFGGAVCPGGQGLSALRAVLGRGPRLYRFHLFLFPFRVSAGPELGFPVFRRWSWSSL